MRDKMGYLRETPSQTAGPYVHIGLAPSAAGFTGFDRELGADIAGPKAKGQRIRIEGCVFDGTGAPVKDAMMEIWQANAEGHFAHPEGGGDVEQGFRGWGRVSSDFETGEWAFDTVKPGAVALQGRAVQAPHISLWVVARGINIGLHTRLYFEDETEANTADPVLELIDTPQRRATLMAHPLRKGVYRFDIRLQGEGETVFFDV